MKVTPAGYIVGAGGGFLSPGCRVVGQATTTVPNRPTPDADGAFLLLLDPDIPVVLRRYPKPAKQAAAP